MAARTALYSHPIPIATPFETNKNEINYQIQDLQEAILTHHLAQLTLRGSNAAHVEQVVRSVAYSALGSMHELPSDYCQSLGREEIVLLNQQAFVRESLPKSIASMVELMKEEQNLKGLSEHPTTLSSIQKYKEQLGSLDKQIEEKNEQDAILSEEIHCLCMRLQTVKNNKTAINRTLEGKKAQRCRLNAEIDKLSKNKLPLEKALSQLELNLKMELYTNEQALQTCRLGMQKNLSQISFLQQQFSNATERIIEIQSIFIENMKEKNIDPTEVELMTKLAVLKEKAKIIT